MVSAYMKLSNECNMGCTHCYLPVEVRSSSTLMDDETFKLSLFKIRDLAQSKGDTEVAMLWHGGEPLQFDKAVFEKKLVAADTFFLSNGIISKNILQTSLINLDLDWVRIIKRYFNAMVGVSVDLNSRSLNGDVERYNLVLEKRIQFAISQGLDLVANVCPSVEDLGSESDILDWLDKNDISSFSIDRYNAFGAEDKLCPTNKQHSEYLSNLMLESLKRIKNNQRVAQCSTIVSAIGGVVNNASGGRWGVSCLTDFIVIDPDGKTNTCPDKISFEADYAQDGDFVNSPQRIKVIAEHVSNHPTDGCFTCEFFSWCKSGCPITKNNWVEQGECSGYKLFLKKIQVLIQNGNEEIMYYFGGER